MKKKPKIKPLTDEEIEALANLEIGGRIWGTDEVFRTLRQMRKAINQLKPKPRQYAKGLFTV